MYHVKKGRIIIYTSPFKWFTAQTYILNSMFKIPSLHVEQTITMIEWIIFTETNSSFLLHLK